MVEISQNMQINSPTSYVNASVNHADTSTSILGNIPVQTEVIFQSDETLLEACDFAVRKIEEYSQLLNNNGTGRIKKIGRKFIYTFFFGVKVTQLSINCTMKL